MTITIKPSKSNSVISKPFTINHYSEGDSVQVFLNKLNNFRSPSTQIRNLYDNTGLNPISKNITLKKALNDYGNVFGC